MPRPDGWAADLDVVGQLSILADECPLQVDFRGGVIEVVLPDYRTALRLLKRFPRGDRRSGMRSIQASLARAGLELQVLVGRRRVGRLAAASRPNWLARRLGVDPMELGMRRHTAAPDVARSVDEVSDDS